MSKLCRQFLIIFALSAIVLDAHHAFAADAFAEATQLYQSSQWQQAATAFDRIAQTTQNNEATRLTAQLYAGESLVQLGKYAEARHRYQLVQKSVQKKSAPPAPLAAQALFRLGEVAWLSGESEAAAELLQAYVDKHPAGASTSFAQTYLQQIRQQQSSQANFAVLDEAVGWERDGRHDAALAAYRKLLQQHTSRDQIRAEALRRVAKLHDRLAQSREAIELYQQFLTEFPHAKQTVEVQTAVAWLHDRLDQPTQAAEQFRGVVAKFPQSPQAAEAAYWLARDHADKQDNTRSNKYVDWLLAREDLPKRRPKLWGKTLCLKCQLLAGQGEWQQIDKLVETTEGRLDDGPLSTKLEFWAAEAAFRLRKYKTAKDRFTKLQPKTIGIGQSWTAMIPLRRAQLAARRQQWSAVLKILDQLERDHPNFELPDFELNYEVDYLRGRAMAGRGNMTAARKFYRRVLDNRAAADTEAATMAGWMTGETFFHQRDYTRARSAYQKVMEQTSFSEWQSRAALQAGKCWELEQHWDEAAEVYTAALERWPDSDSDSQLELRLRWAQSQQKNRK
ncbi:MAG: tetratricopeptide repeat protein [Planctomycetes bacterium]|nr:tetratricopeptide repeat protein [Planctomycetota bacterium]